MGENTEKYITFSVSIKEELDNGKTVTCKIRFIESCRFMSKKLLSLVDNLSEGLHNYECVDCKSYLDYLETKDDQLILRCFKCKKNHKKTLIKI